MKSRNFWAVVCLFLCFALPAVAQEWEQKQMITLPNKIVFNEFSKCVAVSGNNLLVANSIIGNGEVYAYEKVNDVWVYKQTLKPTNVENLYNSFGYNLKINGAYAVISSINKGLITTESAVYIFKKENGVWHQIQKLTLTTNQGCSNTQLGEGLEINDDYIIVNSYCNASAFGAWIHIYKKNANTETWELLNTFKTHHPEFVYFGRHIKLQGDWLIVRTMNEVVLYNFTQNINNNTINWIPTTWCNIQEVHEPYVDDNSTNTFIINLVYDYGNSIFETYIRTINGWKKTSIKKAPYLNNMGNTRKESTIAYNNDYLFQGAVVLDTVRVNQKLKKYQGFRTFRKLSNIWVFQNKTMPNNPIANKQIGSNITILNNENIFVTGYDNSANPLDTVSVIYHFQKTRGNFIKGKVYNDLNANCQKEAGEVGKEYYTIKAEPGNYITSTDENGNYELEVGAGAYTISQVIPQAKGLQVTQLCPAGAGTHTVSFTGLNNEVSGYDFGNNVKECTFLTVDVTARRRRCFRNQAIVKYENEGVAVANNAYITVTFPEYVIPLSSTNPWINVTGNTYKFNVGTLQAGQRGQFIVTDSVACVAGIQGLIQCTEAKIYPKNTCASPTWSGASLEIVGKCLNIAPQKGRFVLRNTGTALLQSVYKVSRGNTLILNNLLTLAQGDSLVLEIPTNGENLFIEANQAVGHPDGAMISATVMNCGNAIPVVQGSNQTQMMIVPNDEYANSETDCVPIVDSYDPNDKAVTPIGITENNYVKPNTELEYKIRFQNLGTAEAVNIVVIDTLSTHLDLTAFQMMSASHTYKLKFERVNGKQVAFWTFSDINLPAKSVNEPASHGYIKFKIKHLPTLVEGTIIKNFADIYFDFNELVRTNETKTNMTDYQFPVNPIDYCDLFAKANAGQARTVCGNSYTLEGNTPTMGQGTWTRISGAGEVTEPNKNTSAVTNLGVGNNVFKWTLTGVPDCANTESIVTIKRLPDASVSISNNASNNIACAEENITFSTQVNNVGNASIYQWKVNNQSVGTNSPTFATTSLQNLDKVSLEVQTNLGCANSPKVFSQTIEMTVKAKPAKPIISHASLHELKSNVEGDVYAWYKDNVLINNNLPTLRIDKMGKYKVIVTKNGCSSPASDDFVLDREALNRFTDLVKVETYPNPTTGRFTLNITNNQGGEVDIQLYNSLGQLISQQRVEASEEIDCKVTIDLTPYKQGVYYAKISNKAGLQTTQKIVVQKQ